MIRSLMMAGVTLLAGTALAHDAPKTDPYAPEPSTEAEILAAFGWDFEATEIKAQSINDKIHVLFGLGGNIGVLTGDQGTLIVDDQFPQLTDKILAKIKELGGDGVDFAINTHFHFDHADGNKGLAPTGTWFVSHESAREEMGEENLINLLAFSYKQAPYPEEARPIITYTERMKFHFNGEEVELIHEGPAHTTGDTAVYFRTSNVIHMGDVFVTTGYPFLDAGNGGGITGSLAFNTAILEIINENTVIVPGHGEVTDFATYKAFVDMLKVVHGKLKAMADADRSMEEVVASKPTAEFDETYGDPALFVNRAYFSLTGK